MRQAAAIEQVEHGAVGELVAGDPPAAAIAAAHQRDAFGLGHVVAGTDIAAQVLALQVVLAQAGAGGHVLLGDQQAVVVGIAEQRLRHPDRTGRAGVTEGPSRGRGPLPVGLPDLVALEAVIQLFQRRHDVIAPGVLAGHVGVADQHVVTAIERPHPQPVGLLQLLLAKGQQRGEIGQREHLHPMVVAFDHEGEAVVDGGDTVGAAELAQSGARTGHRAQALAAVAVIHHQLVAGLGRGYQHQLAILQPAGRRVDVVLRRGGRDEGFLDHHVRHRVLAQQHIVVFVLVRFPRRIGLRGGTCRIGNGRIGSIGRAVGGTGSQTGHGQQHQHPAHEHL